MRPTAGVTFGGRYELSSRIAVGGMGEVWRARDSRLERVVAVKVMRPSAADEQEFVDRFRDEARHTAALSHPNIATVYDYGEDDGAAYLVMELVEGLPLSQLIARGPMSPERVRSIMGQAALALADAMASVQTRAKPNQATRCMVVTTSRFCASARRTSGQRRSSTAHRPRWAHSWPVGATTAG